MYQIGRTQLGVLEKDNKIVYALKDTTNIKKISLEQNNLT